MRLGLITPDFSPSQGELGSYAYELYRHLGAVGWEPVVLTSTPASAPGVAYLRAGGPINFSIKVSLRCSGFLASSGVDLLHLVGGPDGVTLFTRCPKPVVYTVAGLLAHRHGYLRTSLPWALPRAMRQALERRSYRQATHLVCPWPSVGAALVEWYGVASERVTVLPPGVDLNTFSPPGREREPGRLLYVGSPAPHQGFPILLEAMQEVVKVVPSAHLVVAGGNASRGYQVARRVREMKLEDHFRLVGQLSQEGLVEEYRRSEALVAPSLVGGLGVSCLEAMACGLPVVGTRVPGVGDVVEDGVTGLLVPPEDADALAAALVALLEERERRRLLGEQGRARMEDRHDWRTLVPRLVSLYERVLQEN